MPSISSRQACCCGAGSDLRDMISPCGTGGSSNARIRVCDRMLALSSVQKPADFEANPALKLGVIRGFRHSASADGLVDRLDALGRVSFATQLDPLYQVLLDGRVQAMIIEPVDYPTLDSAHIRSQTRILAFDDPPVPHGLIMSRKSLPAPQQQAWRELIDGMRADGTVQRLFERYFSPDLARAMTRF